MCVIDWVGIRGRKSYPAPLRDAARVIHRGQAAAIPKRKVAYRGHRVRDLYRH